MNAACRRGIAVVHYQPWRARVPPSPPFAQTSESATFAPSFCAARRHQRDFRVGIAGKAVERDDRAQPPNLADVAQMAAQVRQAALQRCRGSPRPARPSPRRRGILSARTVATSTTALGTRSAMRHLMSIELFRAEIRAEARLRHHDVGQTERRLGARSRCCSRGRCWRTGRRARTRACRSASARGSGCSASLSSAAIAPCAWRSPAVTGCSSYVRPTTMRRDARLEIGDGGREAEHRHDLAGGGDVKPVLARHAVGLAAEAVDDAAELPVVHIHAALPRHAARVDPAGRCPAGCWLSTMAASRLFAAVMACMSPVKCRLISSIGTTCA